MVVSNPPGMRGSTWFLVAACLGFGSVFAVEPELYPLRGADGVNPDVKLRLTFDRIPEAGSSGRIRVIDEADGRLVDEIDMAVPAGPTERRENPKPPYTPVPYEYGPSTKTNANTRPGTPSGVAVPTPDHYQLTIIGGFTDGFHFHPVTVRGETATIHLHHNLLEYGKTYRVEIDRGVLRVPDGVFEGVSKRDAWVFSTKERKPSLDAGRLTVDAGGGGDFDTVQGAMDFVPDHHPEPVEVFIRNGEYEEIVYFRNKANVTLRGESRKDVIVRYANREVFNPHPANVATNEVPGTFPSRRAVFMIDNSRRIRVENLTIHNTSVRAQAEGLLVNGSENVFRNVTIIGSGDALQSNGSASYENCRIEGWGDTILGRGPGFFRNCTLVSEGPYMWVRNTEAHHGYVFVDCVFDTPEGGGTVIARSPTNKGRHYPFAEAVLIRCKLRRIDPIGWGRVGGDPANVRYWEHASTRLEDGKPVDVSRRSAVSRQLRLPEDAGWIEKYSDPAFVLGGWKPE